MANVEPTQSTAIEDNLTITDAEVISFLALDSTLAYPWISMLITTAKQLADKFCNNPFNSSGVVVIPDAVKFGVLMLISSLYNRMIMAQGGQVVSGPMIEQKAGDLMIKYGDITRASIYYGPNNLPDDVVLYLKAYRLTPGKAEVVSDYGKLSS